LALVITLVVYHKKLLQEQVHSIHHILLGDASFALDADQAGEGVFLPLIVHYTREVIVLLAEGAVDLEFSNGPALEAATSLSLEDRVADWSKIITCPTSTLLTLLV
jgi:hypothetical protein